MKVLEDFSITLTPGVVHTVSVSELNKLTITVPPIPMGLVGSDWDHVAMKDQIQALQKVTKVLSDWIVEQKSEIATLRNEMATISRPQVVYNSSF